MANANYRGYDPSIGEDVWTIGGLLALKAGSGRIQDGNQALYDIVVAKWGSDTLGNGTFLAPYLTLAKAFTMVTATRKNVILMPGEYSSAASLAWPVGVTNMLITGITSDYESTVIKATAGDEVIEIVPDATIGAENVLCFFANLTIEGASGVNGVQITNTNMTSGKKLIVTFRDCGLSNDLDTNKSIVTTHTDVDSLIKVYMHGRGFGGNNIEGLAYFDLKNAGDRVKCNGMHFEGGIQFASSAVAAELEFLACVMKLSGGSGGNAAMLLRANGCISRDGMTQAVAVKGDFCTNGSDAYLSLA